MVKSFLIRVKEFVPNVIEPAFGIGRIMYSLLEHCFWTREGEDECRRVLSFPPALAPVKCLIVPLSGNAQFSPFIRRIGKNRMMLATKLRKKGVTSRIDDSSSSIGKRYARNDELGTPFGVTVDFQTVQDGTVTLRERDSMKQYRASEDVIINAIHQLVVGVMVWREIEENADLYVPFVSQQVE
jgi:glycyl-tRNA synthetase